MPQLLAAVQRKDKATLEAMLTDDFAVEIADADRLDKNESGECFVVDVWKKSDDSWKLATRYVAKLKALPPTSRIVPKPTGKQ